MLSLYRRHKPACKLADAGIVATNCTCPIWTYGSINGRGVRRSLSTKDWTHAHKKMVALEAGPVTVESNAPDVVTVEKAVESYLEDCRSRHLKTSTMAGYTFTLESFAKWCAAHKQGLKDLTVASFSTYRASRELGPNAQCTEITILRMWCKYCVDRDWLSKNHAKAVKFPKQSVPPTMPFERDEITRLLANCCKLPQPEKIRAFVLTLLYSGLRISDAIQLERSKVQSDGRLLLRMEKTGHPVYVRLPQGCMAALNALPVTGEHFFWDKRHMLSTEIAMTRTQVGNLGLLAGVPNCHPHRFRDHFAVSLLLAGVDIRTVQKLLGHTSITTTEKHYSPWVTAMQGQLDEAVAKLAF